MKIDFAHSNFVYFFKDSVGNYLPERHKKVMLIAFLALSFFAIVYVARHCFHARKVEKLSPVIPSLPISTSPLPSLESEESALESEESTKTEIEPGEYLSWRNFFKSLFNDVKEKDEYKQTIAYMDLTEQLLNSWKIRSEERLKAGITPHCFVDGKIYPDFNQLITEISTFEVKRAHSLANLSFILNDSPIEKINFQFDYNWKLDKWVVVLVGHPLAKSLSGMVIPTIFEYQVTNTKTQAIGKMRHMLPTTNNKYSSITTNSESVLQNCQPNDKDLVEFLCQNDDSAFLLEHEVEYLIEFPKEYNLASIPIKISLKP